jgi:hypothetical protein
MALGRVPDQEVALQILTVFLHRRVLPEGFLKRPSFSVVRDGDFQRGMDRAIANGWVRVHERDRYRYILTGTGYDEYSSAGETREALLSSATALA